MKKKSIFGPVAKIMNYFFINSIVLIIIFQLYTIKNMFVELRKRK